MSNWERATEEVLPDPRLDITYILTTCGFQFIIEEPMYEICEKTKLDIEEEGSMYCQNCKTSQEERLLKNAGYQLEFRDSVVTKLQI